jgi:hypothetical protein
MPSGFLVQAARAGTDIMLVPGYDSERIRPFHSEPALLPQMPVIDRTWLAVENWNWVEAVENKVPKGAKPRA